MPKLSAVVNISRTMPVHCFVTAPTWRLSSAVNTGNLRDESMGLVSHSMSAQHLQHLSQHGPRTTSCVCPAAFMMS